MTYRWLLLCWLTCLSACPQTQYHNFYLDVTHYQIDRKRGTRTAKGILVVRADSVVTPTFLQEIDRLTDQVDACLQTKGFKPIKRNWFGVFVPADWYVSTCSGEQLIPSTPPCQGCYDKNLPIPKECCGLAKPTTTCPCVCNCRAVAQGFWLITTPNLKLFKAEMCRISTGVNSCWGRPDLVPCL
jgi:hypothetical protein